MWRALILLALIARPAMAEPVVIFAASSLKAPLDDIIAASDVEAVVSYGGSATLARQVIAGAPADLVMLAHPMWMDELAGAGALAPGTRAAVLSNRLVLAATAPGKVPLTAEGLTAAREAGRIAMGITTAVPVGIYGRAALEDLGLWSTVAPHLAEVDSARAGLALLARGAVPLAVLYQSDLALVPGLHVAATFPADSHPPIRYEIAAIGTPDPAALALLAEIVAADAPFAAAGFVALTAEAGQ